MTSLILYYCLAGIAVLALFISGVKIRNVGIPYKTNLLAIHKLATLTLLAVLVIVLKQWKESAAFSTSIWVLIGIVAVLFLVVLVSGGRLAHRNESNPALAVLHKLTAFVFVVLGAALVYGYLG